MPFSELYQLMVKKVAFVGFRWAIAQIAIALPGSKGVRKGGEGLELTSPPWAWYFTKFYYLRKGD